MLNIYSNKSVTKCNQNKSAKSGKLKGKENTFKLQSGIDLSPKSRDLGEI